MKDWKTIVSIISLVACFLLSPILFPNNPDISERLMLAMFALMGLGVGVPAFVAGINILRGKQ